MSETRVRDKQIKVYVTERERKMLKRKSEKARMTVSDYVRESLVHSDKLRIVQFDIDPLAKALSELRKQGANLNQLMRFLNTYGADAFDAETVNRRLVDMGNVYVTVMEALISLREEAEKHKVFINLESDLFNDEE